MFSIPMIIGLVFLCIFWKRFRAQLPKQNRPTSPPIQELYPAVAPLAVYRADGSVVFTTEAKQPLMASALFDPSVTESVLSGQPPQVYAPSPSLLSQIPSPVPAMPPSDAAEPPLPFASSPPPFNNYPPPWPSVVPVGAAPPPPFLSPVSPLPPFLSPTSPPLPFLSAASPPPTFMPSACPPQLPSVVPAPVGILMPPPPAYASPSVTLVEEKQMPMAPAPPPPQPLPQPLLMPPMPIHLIAAAPQMIRPFQMQRPVPVPLPQGAPLPNPTRILGRRDMSEMRGGAPVQFRPTRQYHRYRASLDPDDFDYQADLDAYFARHHNRANWHPEPEPQPQPQPPDNPSRQFTSSEASASASASASGIPLQQRTQQTASGAGASPQKTDQQFRIFKRTSFRASMENPQEPTDEDSVRMRNTASTSPMSTLREPIYENWPIKRNSDRQLVTSAIYRQILSTAPEEDDEVYPTHVYENWPPPPDVVFEVDRTDGGGARACPLGVDDQSVTPPPPVPRRDPRPSRPRPFSNAADSRPHRARARSLSPRKRPAQTLPPLDDSSEALPILPRKVLPRTPATPRSRAAQEFAFSRFGGGGAGGGRPSVSSGSRKQSGGEPLLHTFSSDSDVRGAVSRHLQVALARARELENVVRRRQPLPATPHLNDESFTAREPPPLPYRVAYKSLQRPAGTSHGRNVNVAALKEDFLRAYRQPQQSSRSTERKRLSADALMIIQRAILVDSALHPVAKNSVEHFRPKAKRSVPAAEALEKSFGSQWSAQRLRRANSEPREAGALSIAQDDTRLLLQPEPDAATDDDFEPPPPHVAGGGHRSRDREAASGGFRYTPLHTPHTSAAAGARQQPHPPRHQSPPKVPKSFKFFAHAL